MSYPNGKGCSTPVPKGRLNYCPSCVYYIHQEPDQSKIKYPCRKSHQQVRKAAGINYARDFRDCALYEKVNVPFLVEILPHKYVEKYKVEKWTEDKIGFDKEAWIQFLIFMGLFLMVSYMVEHIK